MAIFWDIHQKQDWEFENQLPELAEVSKLDLSWVQCNRCMRKMIKYETLRYGLTNCGHIFCENCLKNATQPKCFVCQSANPRAIVLDPQNLRPELRTQFLAIVPTSQTRDAPSRGAGEAAAPPDFGRSEGAAGQRRRAALLPAPPDFWPLVHPWERKYGRYNKLYT